MEKLNSIEAIEKMISENDLAFLYFSTDNCNVCHALLPKVNEMLLRFPHVKSGRIDLNELKEASGKYSVFTIPTLILFVQEKETLRKSRFVNMNELEEGISRFYNLIIK